MLKFAHGGVPRYDLGLGLFSLALRLRGLGVTISLRARTSDPARSKYVINSYM